MTSTHASKLSRTMARTIFFAIVNIILVAITGFLTLDAWANMNSRIGALLLSVFIPVFIVYQTPSLSGLGRVLRFGTGYILYFIISIVLAGWDKAFTSMLLPCLLVSMTVLNFGDLLIRRTSRVHA